MNEGDVIRPVASFPDLSLAQVTDHPGERLPRWEAKGAVYDISLHLADSVPVAQLNAWLEQRALTRVALADPNLSEVARQALVSEIRSVYNEKVEKYLVAGHGECLLKRPEVAQAVADVVKRDNGRGFALHVLTIMPNHLHVIAGGFAEAGEMKKRVDAWKRVSAHVVNRLCGRKGEVWRRDAYTRIVRSREEYLAKLKYVWGNPEAAGLTVGFWRERYV